MAALLLTSRYPQIGDIKCASPAFFAEDWVGVHTPRSKRGEDWTAPGTAGELYLPRTAGARLFNFALTVTGDFEEDGTPYADPAQGLRTNMDLLEDEAEGLVTFSDVNPTATRTAQAIILFGEPAQVDDNTLRIVVNVKIPTGTWT